MADHRPEDVRGPGARRRLTRALAGVNPVAGASVMGSGIVSTALLATGRGAISVVPLVVACGLWLALVALLVARLAQDRAAVLAGEHAPAALTAVAGTSVLGGRFTAGGTPGPGWAALALAAIAWGVLVPGVLRQLARHGLPGSAFLLTVATASLGVVAASLARGIGSVPLAWVAGAAVLLALVLYVDVLRRFDVAQVGRGHGDHWVAGGALAICVLAAADVAMALRDADAGGVGLWRVVTAAVGVVALAWLVVLLLGEVSRPRPVYDARRWATVFPVGMYAAAAMAAGQALPAAAARDGARAWAWVALALWVVVLCGLLRRVTLAVRAA